MAAFRSGDKVLVPWSLGEREGTVVDSFGPPAKQIVSVRLYFSDEEDAQPEDIGFPASAVRHVAPA